MSGQRKYSMELRERATRMALEARADPERRRGAIKRIGGQLGVNPEALRTWVRAVEQGGRNERGEVSDQEARIRALEAENRELRRANEILKAASAFSGRSSTASRVSLRLYRGQSTSVGSRADLHCFNPVWGAGCSQCLLRRSGAPLVGAQCARRGAHRRDQTRVGGELLRVRGAQNARLPQHSRVGRGARGALHG